MKKTPILIKFSLSLFLLTGLAFSLSAGVSYALNFTGEAIQGGNMLSWKTAMEENNHHFTIERSTDGIQFEVATKIEGAGSSTEVNQYRFLDIREGNAKTFYRLIQVDYDGTTALSHTIILTAEEDRLFEITAVNTSVTDRYFTMTVDSKVSSEMEYRVMTMMGDVQKKGTSQMVKGMNAIAIDLKEIKKGDYQFALKVQNEIEVLVIQKTDKYSKPVENLATKNKTIRN